MTRKTLDRRVRDGHVKQPRAMTAQERMELQQLHLMTTSKQFEAAQAEVNTLLLPRKEMVAELKAMAAILQNAENDWISLKIAELGYPPGFKCTIDFATGEIHPA